MIEITTPIDIVKVLKDNNLLIEQDTVESKYIKIKIKDTKNCTNKEDVDIITKYAVEIFNHTLGDAILYSIKDKHDINGLLVKAKVLESNGEIKLNLDNYLCLDITWLNKYHKENNIEYKDYDILLIPKDIKIVISNHEVNNELLLKHKDIDGVTYEERCNLSILYDSQVYKCTKGTFDWHFGENNQWDGIFGLSYPYTNVYNPYVGFILKENKEGKQLEFDFTKNINYPIN